MQLTEIELTNWGPFFGTHVIDLGVTETAPVVLFHGENMRGKTSLLRGIVWCLYGALKEQDGRTPLDVSGMVNTDALQTGETDFGVRLKFTHQGNEYTLYRSATAVEDQPGRAAIRVQKVDLIPTGALPYPAARIPDEIDGILSREISDFFLFDGEMLNRFEERLREERSSAQGFVRTQVERALGLPFMKSLSRDIDQVLSDVTSSIEQVLRRTRAHDKLSDEYNSKTEVLAATERNIGELKEKDDKLTTEIDDVEAQLAKVDEIKDAYHERKSLEREIDSSERSIDDYQESMAERAETTWWLAAGDVLYAQLEDVEEKIVAAEKTERERIRTEVRIQNLTEQLNSQVCPTCGQPVTTHNEATLRDELAALTASLGDPTNATLDELRVRRDKLRKFSNAPGVLSWFHDQERDLRRERLKNEKREQRIRQISELLIGSNVEIDTLEKNLIELKSTKARVGSTIEQLETRRTQLKQEVQKLGTKLASQPEVDPTERRLQHTASAALDVVNRSFDAFSIAMRGRVEAATSELFRQLTTEKEYSGVSISPDYLLAVTDHQNRPVRMISAGANQILTMAFIGALGECSVDEAPMVMDTPFGRLDVGHRRAILEWVSTFDRQVILFVQSGEYDPSRDAHLLGGKIGREYTIERLTPTRSEVKAA